MPLKADRARRRPGDRGDHLHQRGLPRAVRPEQPDDAAADGERDVAHAVVAAAELLTDTFEYEHAHVYAKARAAVIGSD